MLVTYAITISTLCYIACAVDNIRQKDFPHALIWLAYATANMGFLWYEFTKSKS
jgi:hypothetical protein